MTKFDRAKHNFIAVDPRSREQIFVPIAELGQLVVKEVERIEISAPPADLGPIRQELAEKMAAVFVKMEQELNKKIAALEGKILQEADRRARMKIQALAVVNCVQTQEPIDLDAVPDLVAEVAAAGQPVTEQAIIEAADRHLAASFQAGRA